MPAPPVEIPDMGPHIDREIFAQVMDLDDNKDRKFSLYVVQSYFVQAFATFTEMETLLDNGEYFTLSEKSHYLKGSSATLGLREVHISCEDIRRYAKMEDSGDDTPEKRKRCDDMVRQILARVRVEAVRGKRSLRQFYREVIGGWMEADNDDGEPVAAGVSKPKTKPKSKAETEAETEGKSETETKTEAKPEKETTEGSQTKTAADQDKKPDGVAAARHPVADKMEGETAVPNREADVGGVKTSGTNGVRKPADREDVAGKAAAGGPDKDADEPKTASEIPDHCRDSRGPGKGAAAAASTAAAAAAKKDDGETELIDGNGIVKCKG